MRPAALALVAPVASEGATVSLEGLCRGGAYSTPTSLELSVDGETVVSASPGSGPTHGGVGVFVDGEGASFAFDDVRVSYP